MLGILIASPFLFFSHLQGLSYTDRLSLGATERFRPEGLEWGAQATDIRLTLYQVDSRAD